MPESIILFPPPVYFIKSISEQGYTLSTAIADLIDNSISAIAGRIEILIDTSANPLKIFIADNGCGMTADSLTDNMRLPSADMEYQRINSDLGRFGMGLKTASFSQSRCFTVISKTSDSDYAGRTWDVEYLKETKDWTLILETKERIQMFLDDYKQTSSCFHSENPSFIPKTLIIWEQLYKLEKLKNKSEINDELEELRGHLSLVFHRFIQSRKIVIRLNNAIISGFDPFPLNIPGVQTVSESFWKTGDTSYIKFQGIVLPKRSAEEAKNKDSVWVTEGASLEELQGIYVYRNERLINYGAWHRAIPKSVYLQFGRIKIDFSNVNDSDFQLNVAKSSLKIPFGLKRAMAEMVTYVAGQASKEYRERMASNIIKSGIPVKGISLLIKETTATGSRLRINAEFEIMRQLAERLNQEETEKLDTLMDLLEKKINQLWKGEASNNEVEETEDDIPREKIIRIKKYYEDSHYSWEEIRDMLLDNFGRNKETELFINSLNRI